MPIPSRLAEIRALVVDANTALAQRLQWMQDARDGIGPFGPGYDAYLQRQRETNPGAPDGRPPHDVLVSLCTSLTAAKALADQLVAQIPQWGDL